METRDPITPETFVDAVWAEFEALKLPDVPAIGRRISFDSFAELYSALSDEHRVALARVWSMFEQELKRPAIVRLRCVALIFEMADVLDVDMPGYEAIAVEETAEIEPPERTEERIERGDSERRQSILMCAALIQETVLEMGQDPEETRDADLERLRHALAAMAGWMLDTDSASEAFDTQVEHEADEHQEQPDKPAHRAVQPPQPTASRRPRPLWPAMSAGLAAALLVFLWVGLSEREDMWDENRALRAQLAERGGHAMAEQHPVGVQVQPSIHSMTVEPGKPFKAIVKPPNAESMGWQVTVEDAKHALAGPAMPVFSHDDLRQGFSFYIHGDKSLRVIWSVR